MTWEEHHPLAADAHRLQGVGDGAEGTARQARSFVDDREGAVVRREPLPDGRRQAKAASKGMADRPNGQDEVRGRRRRDGGGEAAADAAHADDEGRRAPRRKPRGAPVGFGVDAVERVALGDLAGQLGRQGQTGEIREMLLRLRQGAAREIGMRHGDQQAQALLFGRRGDILARAREGCVGDALRQLGGEQESARRRLAARGAFSATELAERRLDLSEPTACCDRPRTISVDQHPSIRRSPDGGRRCDRSRRSRGPRQAIAARSSAPRRGTASR